MSHKFVRAQWLLAAALGLWAGQTAATAADQSQDAAIQADIAAGEFAPAVALAEAAPDPQQRDAWLAKIALAQAQAGQRDASLRAAADIGDDRVRSSAIASAAAVPIGGQGGGSEADFESLIDLITSTIDPQSWDGVGGPGSIQKFPTGVYVDARGVLEPLLKEDRAGRLAALRAASGPRESGDSVRRSSPLRMVSLPRLEKQIQLRLAAGGRLDETMEVLAGLQRIEYVFVYPQTGDLVVAGPAGDWRPGPENLIVSADTGQPVLRLDDLVVVLRVFAGGEGQFGCMINPRQEGLARFQAFMKESSQRPISPKERPRWLERLRTQLGRQDIEVYGLDPRTRAARVMVEADYRMKLVAMGLEAGVPGVQSYLASIVVPPGEAPPPMAVLRWWFTLNYDAVAADPQRLGFAIRGQGVKVQSENERLSAEGKRLHTGQSEALNRKFAQSFTEHFPELCQKYPIYAELRNLFDLALVGAILRQEGLAEKVAWRMTCFGDPRAFAVALDEPPKEVESVVNCRVVNDKYILAGVSGGVSARPAPLVERSAVEIDRDGSLSRCRAAAAQRPLGDNWWWD